MCPLMYTGCPSLSVEAATALLASSLAISSAFSVRLSICHADSMARTNARTTAGTVGSAASDGMALDSGQLRRVGTPARGSAWHALTMGSPVAAA